MIDSADYFFGSDQVDVPIIVECYPAGSAIHANYYHDRCYFRRVGEKSYRATVQSGRGACNHTYQRIGAIAALHGHFVCQHCGLPIVEDA